MLRAFAAGMGAAFATFAGFIAFAWAVIHFGRTALDNRIGKSFRTAFKPPRIL